MGVGRVEAYAFKIEVRHPAIPIISWVDLNKIEVDATILAVRCASSSPRDLTLSFSQLTDLASLRIIVTVIFADSLNFDPINHHWQLLNLLVKSVA
jgi:hypothetical protein